MLNPLPLNTGALHMPFLTASEVLEKLKHHGWASASGSIDEQSSRDGKTALLLACQLEPELVADVIRLGANPNVECGHTTDTPLMVLIRAARNFPERSGACTLAFEALLGADADIRQATHTGTTALHVAASCLNPSFVTALLAADAPIAAADRKGATPLGVLLLANVFGNPEIEARQQACLDALLAAGSCLETALAKGDRSKANPVLVARAQAWRLAQVDAPDRPRARLRF